MNFSLFQKIYEYDDVNLNTTHILDMIGWI